MNYTCHLPLSQLTIDALLAITFVTLTLAVRWRSFVALLVPGVTAAWTIIAAHNFFHRADNWHMLYFNIGFFSYREWRISHSMSHHLYPNSLHDLEVTLFQPFLCWLTDARAKNLLQRYASWAYGPVVYALLFFDQFVKRVVFSVLDGRSRFHWPTDTVAFVVPVFMWSVADAECTVGVVIGMWLMMLMVASFYFGFVGLNAGHHNHQVVHDGDVLR